jgi:hypothetical protein
MRRLALLLCLLLPSLVRALDLQPVVAVPLSGSGGNTPLPSLAGQLLTSNSTPAWTVLPPGADGLVLTMVGGLPNWASGVVGSTGISSATNFGAMYATSTTTGTSTGALTDGQFLIGRTGLAPVAGSLGGTLNKVSVAAGAGTITLNTGALVVHTNQANTWSTGDQDMSLATSFKVPVAANATTTANGRLAYDSTNHMLHAAQNGIDAKIPQFTSTPPNDACAKWVVAGANYKLDSTGIPCGSGGGTPGGVPGQVQFNNTTFGGSSGLTLDPTGILSLTFRGATPSTTGPISTPLEWVTTGASAITRTLPAAGSGTNSRRYCLYKADSGVGTLTLATSGGNTLEPDSVATKSTSTRWTGFCAQEASNTSWYVESVITLVNLATDVTGLLPGANGGTGLNTTGLTGVAQVNAGTWSIGSIVANPTATIGLAAVNGTATTGLRSDGAPALSQAISPTWTGLHQWARTGGAAGHKTVLSSVATELHGGTGTPTQSGMVFDKPSSDITNSQGILWSQSGVAKWYMATDAQTSSGENDLVLVWDQTYGASRTGQDMFRIAPSAGTTTQFRAWLGAGGVNSPTDNHAALRITAAGNIANAEDAAIALQLDAAGSVQRNLALVQTGGATERTVLVFGTYNPSTNVLTDKWRILTDFANNNTHDFAIYDSVAALQRLQITSTGEVIVGGGEVSNTLAAGVLRGPNATGANIAGVSETFKASLGTGTGNLGTFVMQAPLAKQTTGSTQHTLSTIVTFGHPQSGHPGSAGAVVNFPAITWTDENTAGSGTAASVMAYAFQQPTLAARNTSVTTTRASTVTIANAPVPGTNMTIGTPYALEVTAGNVLLGGALTVSGVTRLANLTANGAVHTSGGNGTLIVTPVSYTTAFTPANGTSFTITGATHGLGTADLVFTCWTGGNPRVWIAPDGVSINTGNFDITLTFNVAQTGRCTFHS